MTGDPERHLRKLLEEYEYRLSDRYDQTPRGVAESLRGDRTPAVLDNAEIIEGLADQLGCLDTPLSEVDRLLGVHRKGTS